jgi:hypothetical protein
MTTRRKIMKKALTFDEFQVLIMRFLEYGNEITIQQNLSPSESLHTLSTSL